MKPPASFRKPSVMSSVSGLQANLQVPSTTAVPANQKLVGP